MLFTYVRTLTLQSNGKTDTTYCGVNSKNVQGCTAGFYQPYDGDVDGPAEVVFSSIIFQ